jgi:hypothetical protein
MQPLGSGSLSSSNSHHQKLRHHSERALRQSLRLIDLLLSQPAFVFLQHNGKDNLRTGHGTNWKHDPPARKVYKTVRERDNIRVAERS